MPSISSEVYGIARQESEPESMPKGGSSTTKIKLRSATLERAALANVVLADIAFCQDNATATFRHRSTAFRLLNRAAENMARIAPRSKPVSKASTPNQVRDDPFSAPVQQAAPEDAPPVDDAPKHLMSSQYEGKQLVGKHLSLVGVSLMIDDFLQPTDSQVLLIRTCYVVVSSSRLICWTGDQLKTR
jgi:hypothetical protein